MKSANNKILHTSHHGTLHLRVVLQPLRVAPVQEEHMHLLIRGRIRNQAQGQSGLDELRTQENKIRELTWNTRSTSKETTNAENKLENGTVHSPAGIVVVLVSSSRGVAPNSCPPFAHSQAMLSWLYHRET